MSSQPEISAIIVIGARTDRLSELIPAYDRALAEHAPSYELVCVLDGSRTAAYDELTAIKDDLSGPCRIVRLSRAFGEATALMCGFDQSSGRKILTLPGYYQAEPEEIGRMIDAFDDADVVQGHRHPRRGSWFENFRRQSFHNLLRWITGQRFQDLGCSMRLMNRRVLEELRLYGDQHRFLPVLAQNAGFKVVEQDVRQSPLDEYREGYRVREYLHRLLDLFTVFFLVRFTKKPLRFFGMLGSIVFAVGGLILLIVIVQRLFFDVALADRPALLLSSLLVVLGLQLFSLGLIGELIIFTHARALKEYKIAEIIETGPAAGEAPSYAAGNRSQV